MRSVPQVIAPVVSRRTGIETVYAMPTACPVCSMVLVKIA